MRTAFAAALLVTIGLTSARADTTFTYVGAPWGDSSTEFGTNLTGSVTFDFDTPGFTGSVVGFNTVPLNLQGIVDVQLTAGVVMADGNADGKTHDIQSFDFDFINGQIVDWNVQSDSVICPSGIHGCILETNNNFDQAFGFFDQPHPFVSAPGATWVIDPASVPAPIMGAGLPSLILAGLGLLGWRQRKRSISAP
jgi:hypothetical protein